MAIAIFTTWTTYGSWLSGDERGWFRRGEGSKPPDDMRHFEATHTLGESAITLDPEQRIIVERTIAEHCAIRRWILHAVHCRSNHVHAVVTAPDYGIGIPREQFKAWCTRKLKEQAGATRKNWWTERGWDEYIDDDAALAEVIEYVKERQ